VHKSTKKSSKVLRHQNKKLFWMNVLFFLVFLEQLRQKKALKTQNINSSLLKKIHAKLSLISIFRLKKHL
jgi:hypothetical protein